MSCDNTINGGTISGWTNLLIITNFPWEIPPLHRKLWCGSFPSTQPNASNVQYYFMNQKWPVGNPVEGQGESFLLPGRYSGILGNSPTRDIDISLILHTYNICTGAVWCCLFIFWACILQYNPICLILPACIIWFL